MSRLDEIKTLVKENGRYLSPDKAAILIRELETASRDLALARERIKELEALLASDAGSELRKHWADFCDADPVPDGFIERMEKAGFTELRAVTKRDLQEPFAAERGIEKGGTVWVLTDAGQVAIRSGVTNVQSR